MSSRTHETPAKRAEKLARRTEYLAAVRMYKDPNASPAEKLAADKTMEEYFAWVDTLPKIGP